MQFEHTKCNSWHRRAKENDFIAQRPHGSTGNGIPNYFCSGCCSDRLPLARRDQSADLIANTKYPGYGQEAQRSKHRKCNKARPEIHREFTVLILHSNNIVTNSLRLFSKKTTSHIILFLCLLTIIYTESFALMIDRQYIPTTNKTGQFSIAQLCPRGSNIPVTRRIEGGALVSTSSDVDINCTITFRTKTAHQHFIIRFEDLKLGCDDHLVLFDQDADYGQPGIHDYSCRDNMATVRDLRTTGTFLTIRYNTDSINQPSDGFRIVVTAVFDTSDCPSEYAYCRDHYCISRSLFCDGVIHCLDGSDELNCYRQEDPNDLPYALGLLVILVLAISTCVIIFIATIYCRRESPYSRYQHHLQRSFGGAPPLQASSSIMFPPNPQYRTQYQFIQPTQMSPFVTPQHQASIGTAATLPRGFSALPLNYADTTVMTGTQQQAYPPTFLMLSYRSPTAHNCSMS